MSPVYYNVPHARNLLHDQQARQPNSGRAAEQGDEIALRRLFTMLMSAGILEFGYDGDQYASQLPATRVDARSRRVHVAARRSRPRGTRGLTKGRGPGLGKVSGEYLEADIAWVGRVCPSCHFL